MRLAGETDIVEVETLEERTRSLLNTPNIDKKILNHVANGGTIIEMARLFDVRFSDIMYYIRSNSELSRRYNEATGDRADWFQQTVFDHLKSILNADLSLIYDEHDRIKPIKDWPREIHKALEAIDINQVKEDDEDTIVRKIKLASKQKTIELLGKTQSMFVEKVKHDHTVTLEDLIGGSYDIEIPEGQIEQ